MVVSVFDCCEKSSVFRLGPVWGLAFRTKPNPFAPEGSHESLPGSGGNSSVSISFVPAVQSTDSGRSGARGASARWPAPTAPSSAAGSARRRPTAAPSAEGPGLRAASAITPSAPVSTHGAAAPDLLLGGDPRAGPARNSEMATGGAPAGYWAAKGQSSRLQREVWNLNLSIWWDEKLKNMSGKGAWWAAYQLFGFIHIYRTLERYVWGLKNLIKCFTNLESKCVWTDSLLHRDCFVTSGTVKTAFQGG